MAIFLQKKPALFILITLSATILFALITPPEKVLGSNVRIVYLHGAWVWSALLLFILAAGYGLIGLILHNNQFVIWSKAIGRTGLLYWITTLPISLWAMQTSWNGLFLAEPRFRFAIAFSIAGLMLQIGLSLMENLVWVGIGNCIFLIALGFNLFKIKNIMHPASPILMSNSISIQIYFGAILFFIFLTAWQIAVWLKNYDQSISSHPFSNFRD